MTPSISRLDEFDAAALDQAVQGAHLQQLHVRLVNLTNEVRSATERLDRGLAQIKKQQQSEDQRPRFRPLVPSLDTTISATESLLASLKHCREFIRD